MRKRESEIYRDIPGFRKFATIEETHCDLTEDDIGKSADTYRAWHSKPIEGHSRENGNLRFIGTFPASANPLPSKRSFCNLTKDDIGERAKKKMEKIR